MNQPTIEFQKVSKSYQIWEDRPSSIKSLLIQLATLNLQLGTTHSTEVLHDISMKIYPGEFVGIMGRNGAGKSSLLKLIGGIYQPTSGRILTHGRITPLLELGAGFAPELNGYENIFLNASVLGYGRKEIESQVNAIIEFSELGENIYKPVQKYSSGMLVRLGFSIAVHLDAEILLFDEILAVGDAGFQAKCLKKTQELHARGRTVVLVTHNPAQVAEFCSRCILFESHGIAFDGATKDGAEAYKALFNI
jgi:lipopolysaccharide transport system ATP-binding protein